MVKRTPRQDAANRQIPVRKRVSYPEADSTTQQWWDAQADPSVSVRLLLRADVERNGYTDVMNRPVVQLPKRGRPAGSGASDDLGDELDAGEQGDVLDEREVAPETVSEVAVPTVASTPTPAVPVEQPVAVVAPAQAPVAQSAPVVTAVAPAPVPAPTPVEAPSQSRSIDELDEDGEAALNALVG